MKALKKTLAVFTLTFVLIVLISLFLPTKKTIMRGIYIKAKPDSIYLQINNLKNWFNWSPWHNKDIKVVSQFDSIYEGTGARYNWKNSTNKNQAGSIIIDNSYPNDSIILTMDFFENGKSKSKFTLNNKKDSTLVSWYVFINLGWNPITKFIGLQFDDFIGKDLEKGLKSIKAECENNVFK